MDFLFGRDEDWLLQEVPMLVLAALVSVIFQAAPSLLLDVSALKVGPPTVVTENRRRPTQG